MSVPVPSTPTNPADLREQVARAIAAADYTQDIWDDLDGCQRDAYLVAADAAIAKTAPVLEGLRAELDAALIQRDKFGQLHLSEAKTHDETIRSLASARDDVVKLQRAVDDVLRLADRWAKQDHLCGYRVPNGNDDDSQCEACAADAIRSAIASALPSASTGDTARPSVSDQTPATPEKRLTCSQVHPEADVYHPEGHPVSPVGADTPDAVERVAAAMWPGPPEWGSPVLEALGHAEQYRRMARAAIAAPSEDTTGGQQ